MYSLLHLECHSSNLKTESMIYFSMSLLPRSVEKRPICMCVCMYVCIYACMYVCMYVCVYVCTFVCLYVSMYTCTHVCMDVRVDGGIFEPPIWYLYTISTIIHLLFALSKGWRRPIASYGSTCNTLQHTATHCNTLQHTTTHCNTPQHTATHRNTPQHTATYWMLWVFATLYLYIQSIYYTYHLYTLVICNMYCHFLSLFPVQVGDRMPYLYRSFSAKKPYN